MPTFTDDQLSTILRTKPGIFVTTQTMLQPLEDKLASIMQRTNFTFDIDLLPIADVKRNVARYQSQQKTHLGIYYGLENRKLRLSFWAVTLSPDAQSPGKPQSVSADVFSGSDARLSNDAVERGRHRQLRRRFKEIFTTFSSNGNIILGAYLKLENLLSALTTFEGENNCTKLRITLGFMESQGGDDPACFHLVFRGVNESPNPLSNSIFSTFDGEPGYSGPKPSCPPFGEAGLE